MYNGCGLGNTAVDILVSTHEDRKRVKFSPLNEQASLLLSTCGFGMNEHGVLIVSESDCDDVFRLIDDNELNTLTMG